MSMNDQLYQSYIIILTIISHKYNETSQKTARVYILPVNI